MSGPWRDFSPRDPDYHVSVELAHVRRRRRAAAALWWLLVIGFAAFAFFAAAFACGWPSS